MEKKAASGIMLTLLLISMLTFAFNVAPGVAEEPEDQYWVPFVPPPSQVNIAFGIENQRSYIDVSITLEVTQMPQYRVSDWGSVVKDGYNLWVNSRVELWTGLALQIYIGWVTWTYRYDLGYLEDGTYTFTFDVCGFTIKSISFTLPLVATMDIDPDTLNLRSKGKWITAYVELPEGFDVADINVSSILLNGTIQAEPKPIVIGDYDEDGFPDLMVKFDRASVVSLILDSIDLEQLVIERFMYLTLTITGKLYDGTPFQGSDTIGVIYMGYRGAFYRALSQMLREHKTCTEKLLI